LSCPRLCSSREILVPLKRVGQTCPKLYTRVNLVDFGQRNDKNDYYYNFKIRLGVDLWPSTGHRSGWPLTRVNVRIKMNIIIVLKLNSGVDMIPVLGHGSCWPMTQVNLRIKIIIIIVLKPDLRVDQRPSLINQARVMVLVGHWPRST